MDIHTKFDIGDRVWAIEDSRAVCFEVRGVQASAFRYTDDIPQVLRVVYNGDGTEAHREDTCFATKDELLNSL